MPGMVPAVRLSRLVARFAQEGLPASRGVAR
jgi:hypothetical protein